MELSMSVRPRLAQVDLIVRRVIQLMQRSDDSRLPSHLACWNRSPQTHQFDFDPRLGQVVDILRADWSHSKAPLRRGDDQALGRQPRECLANDPRANAHLFSDFLNLELPPIRQPP